MAGHLLQVVRIREEASRRLPEWSLARFNAESATVDRLLDAGRFAEAVEAAGKIVERGRVAGDEAAAVAARERAIEAYLAYRRAGGENHTPGGRLALAVGQALDAGQTEEIAAQLAALRERPDLPRYLQVLIPALQAILAGSRDPALAADPALDYDDAVEVLLLLEG